MGLPPISPPLVNSANPWAATLEDLQTLFDCPYTGAVTIRTSLLSGFDHDETKHQYTFFSTEDHSSTPANVGNGQVSPAQGASLNTLGYSPISLSLYLSMIPRIIADSSLPDEVRLRKPIIISVTGSSKAIVECYQKIRDLQSSITNPLCMEINLSCPNIPGKPPPAYSSSALWEYLRALVPEPSDESQQRVAIGIKTPPYTYHDQFVTLIDALRVVSSPVCPVDFITATNTLGSCLVLADSDGTPALDSASGAGIGGMAGAPLHPLALGNVRTIRTQLDEHETLKRIEIIGVGGVADRCGFDRMRAVGAEIVGVGTALGQYGVEVFAMILNGQAIS